MRAITTLRSLVAAPLRGTAGAFLIAVVIAGVVSMHSMSGSPSVHLPPPAIAAAHGTERADLTDVVAGHTGEARPEHAAGHGAHSGSDVGQCPTGCGSHDMTTAMCLMVLVVLLTLAVPPASFWAAAIVPLAQRLLVVAPRSRPAVPPSLHALGISRT